MTVSRITETRPFRLIDAMSLIAVVSLAMYMTRSYLRCFSVLSYLVSTEPSNVRVMGLREWLYAGVPTLLLISASLWPLRLARPGNRSYRTARLPGMAVSYAAWTALAFALVRSAFVVRAWLATMYFPDVGVLPWSDGAVLRVIATKDMIGSAVAVSWLVLWLAGLWRTEPSWIDRLGRVLGVYWIVFGLAFWVVDLVKR
jgi:hypothetical protein